MTDSQVAAELIELERQRGVALVQRDEAALNNLFCDDLVHTHTTGNSMNKTELIHYVMKVLQFLTVTRSNLQVRVYGNTAVMTGAMRNSMQRVDRPDVVTADALVTQVWVRMAGGWKLCSFHACRAAEPARI
jgi:ketosteroid isomerase-like protein